MTNWPAYVPVIVEDCPAASRPIAHIYLALGPTLPASASAALYNVRSLWSGLLTMKTAKVAITHVLMTNDMKSDIALSSAL